jgi:hypothetical protein
VQISRIWLASGIGNWFDRTTQDLVRKSKQPVRWSILIFRAKAVWLGDAPKPR